MDTLHLVESDEDVDPLASSGGMSIDSFEDGLHGKKTRKKSKASTLSRLRKLKKPDSNGLHGGFAPHPPADKPAWNSPRKDHDDQSRLIPNGVGSHETEESPDKIDPFTGEVIRTRKKLVPSDEHVESLSPTREETVDPFTGQTVKTKKKRDQFTVMKSTDFQTESIERDVKDGHVGTFRKRHPRDAHMNNFSSSSIGNESFSSSKDDSELVGNTNVFTQEITEKSKRKQDPFTAMTSIDFDSSTNRESTDFITKTISNENDEQKKKRDPFTAMNSIDFDSSATKKSIAFGEATNKKDLHDKKKQDPFTAMNSIDFESSATKESQHIDIASTEHAKNEGINKDPFTAMNSIDFDGSTTKDYRDEHVNTNQNTRSSISSTSTHQNNIKDSDTSGIIVGSHVRTPTSNHTFPPVNCNTVIADDETGEQVQSCRSNDNSEENMHRSTHRTDDTGVVTSAPKSNIQVQLIDDGDDLVTSTDTDELQDNELISSAGAGASSGLLPVQEQSTQEHSSAERLTDSQRSRRRFSNRSPLLSRESPRGESVTHERFQAIGNVHDQIEPTSEKQPAIQIDDNSETGERKFIESKQTAATNNGLEIVEDSDSDDLVVIPNSSRKLTPVTAPRNESEINAEDDVHQHHVSPIATSTPSKDATEDTVGMTSGDVPTLNLEGVTHSDDEEGGEIYNIAVVNKRNDRADGSESEDEAIGSDSGSELDAIDSDTLKAETRTISGHAEVIETESEFIVHRKNIPDIRASSANSASDMGSSELLQRGGRLSPIVSTTNPPPLQENYSSLVLRTCYKNDNLSSSMALSEPLMRSTYELSDTNRSFLSTGALPQISTKKARNRSFLSGGMRNTGSLLGREEMERFFPDRKLRIFMATWNMCELKILPNNLKDLLLPEHPEYDTVHDMYVIGTQESTADGSEWEIALQETLGPSHVLLHSATHGVLMLLIFIRRDLIWFCSTVEEDRVSTRPGAMIKTKGAVAAAFTFFGTSFLFINAHFTSGDENMKDRLLDYEKICKGLQLPQKIEATRKYNVLKDDVTTRFDCVFWCGDFNFRLVESRKKVEMWANQLRNGTKTDYNVLLELDQLNRARNKNEIFNGFHEGPIAFVPSYKYDIGDDIFDTSEKKRVPSYTDRVLFKSRKKGDITVLDYMMCDPIKASDHRPVYGVYQVNIRPGKDDMASGGGQFRRDVFIEANKRRAAQAGMSDAIPSQAGSSVCSVM